MLWQGSLLQSNKHTGGGSNYFSRGISGRRNIDIYLQNCLSTSFYTIIERRMESACLQTQTHKAHIKLKCASVCLVYPGNSYTSSWFNLNTFKMAAVRIRLFYIRRLFFNLVATFTKNQTFGPNIYIGRSSGNHIMT